MGWLTKPCGNKRGRILANEAPIKRGPPPQEGRWVTLEEAHKQTANDQLQRSKLRKLWYKQTVHSIEAAVSRSLETRATETAKRHNETANESSTYNKRMRGDDTDGTTFIHHEGDSIDFTTTADSTISIHGTHSWLVECGGFVGCKLCGKYGSVLSPFDSFGNACRGKPPPSGKMTAVNNLTAGKWPHRKRGKTDTDTTWTPTWPSGVPSPHPRFFRLRRPETT